MAGATAMAEFAAQNKACIAVPSPFLAGGHQLKNAEVLARRGAVEIVADNAPAQKLLKLTKVLLRNNKRRQQLADKMAAQAKPAATSKLAKLILTVAERAD